MHFVQAKGILSAHNGMNLYRGCTHGCIYCDSRSHCYQMHHDFEDVEIKENGIALLEDALRRKRKPCMVSTGSMSDPYMPLEQSQQYTRKAMETALQYGCGFSFITKSDLCLRDLDLMRQLNETTRIVVQMTLTTMDEKLSRILEPHVCTTKRRIEVLRILQENGIPTVVWLCPILPYINDTEENIQSILNACADTGVSGIVCFGMGVTLREGNREYFYENLDRSFPGLREVYVRNYGNMYSLNSPSHPKLMKMFNSFCREHHILYEPDAVFRWIERYEKPASFQQMTLF